MSTRQRQSNAAAAQRLELPPYEDPLHSLTQAQQRDLQRLEKLNSLDTLNSHLRHANDCVTIMAADINDRFTERQKSLGRRTGKRAQQPVEEDATDLQKEEKELDEMRDRVDKMTQRMEETVRKIVDSSKYVESIGNGLRDVQRQAVDDAVRTSQQTQNQQNTRSTAEDSESIADFDPTDPASTTPAPASLCKTYTTKLEREKERWQTYSLSTRYTKHKDYVQFREIVHDAQNPDGATERSNPATWFSDRPGSPAPGITRRNRKSGHGGEGSDSDTSDIAFTREHISTKCPLTLREFEDPVTSIHCPHSFEKTAILSLVRSSRGPRGERVVQCPVGGCSQQLTEKDLRRDPTMVRRIQRLQAAKARAAEEDSDDGENAGNDTNVVEEIDSDEDGELDTTAIMGGARSVRPKLESRSSRPPRATTEIVSMGRSDTEEE